MVGAHSAATVVKAVFDPSEPIQCVEPAEGVELRKRIYEDAKTDATKDEL